MTNEICECRHNRKWHYGKEIGNEDDDCRCIYQHKEEGIKSCPCKKYTPVHSQDASLSRKGEGCRDSKSFTHPGNTHSPQTKTSESNDGSLNLKGEKAQPTVDTQSQETTKPPYFGSERPDTPEDKLVLDKTLIRTNQSSGNTQSKEKHNPQWGCWCDVCSGNMCGCPCHKTQSPKEKFKESFNDLVDNTHSPPRENTITNLFDKSRPMSSGVQNLGQADTQSHNSNFGKVAENQIGAVESAQIGSSKPSTLRGSQSQGCGKMYMMDEWGNIGEEMAQELFYCGVNGLCQSCQDKNEVVR